MTNDPHVKLLTKAFGDLDQRPFAWCFDEEQPAPDTAMEVDTMATCRFCGIVTTLDNLYEFTPHGEVGPLYHCRNQRDCIQRETPAAAPQEPREGETYECTLDVLFYLMTNGQMGTRPSLSLQRYEPEPPQK